MNDTIGIDISKDTFDAHRLWDGVHGQFANDKAGFAAFLRWVGREMAARVVYEATGAYHRGLSPGL